MEYPKLSPTPPLLAGLFWRAITRDDLTALARLADGCHLGDGDLAFLNEPGNLKDRSKEE